MTVKKQIELSIVIVNWNTKKILLDCLHSIYKETKAFTFEIIVVDNGSVDGSAESVKRKYPTVKVIENETNIGYSKANNQGIRVSTGKYVCLLNSDTIVLGNALEKMVAFLDQNDFVGAVTCLLINPDGSPQIGSALGETNLLYWLSVETGLYKKYPNSRIWGKPFLSYLDQSITHEIEVCPSAAIIIRKKVFKNTGLLDEKIFFGTIDWDYSLRMRKKGWKLYLFQESKILHYGGKSKNAIRKELIYKDYRSRFYYFKKHYGIFKMNIFRLLIMVSSTIKIFYFLYLAMLNKLREKTDSQLVKSLKSHLIRLYICFTYT